MNNLLKKMMFALLAVGIGQAAWADDIPDFRGTLQAAERGNVKAQNNLGVMYEKGLGVHQDYTQAETFAKFLFPRQPKPKQRFSAVFVSNIH